MSLKPHGRPHGRGNMTLPNTIGSKRILDEKMNTTSPEPAVLVRDANENIREYAGCKIQHTAIKTAPRTNH
jgi:hypothetical protein